MAMKCCTKLETAKERCPIVFQGHPSNFKVTRYKTSPILIQIGRFRTIGQSQLSNPSDLPCFTMFPSSYHHEIFRSYYHDQKWCPCKRSRSKVKVTEVNTQLSRLRTLTPVWIHIWQWNHAHSWKQHRRGALLFFKFEGHTALKIVEFDPDWAFPDCNSSLNSPMATKWCTKLEVVLKRCPIVFQGHPSNFKVTRL